MVSCCLVLKLEIVFTCPVIQYIKQPAQYFTFLWLLCIVNAFVEKVNINMSQVKFAILAIQYFAIVIIV